MNKKAPFCMALSGHFVQSGGLSKKSRFRKPLQNCLFTTELQNFR